MQRSEVAQEHAREAKLEKRVSRDRARMRLLVVLAVGLVVIVGLSVAVNAGVMFALLEATKETSVSESGVLMIKGSNATIEVANSEMSVDATGNLVDKSGSPLQVASDALTVNQATGQITNKAGNVDLAVDQAELVVTSELVAKQLVSGCTALAVSTRPDLAPVALCDASGTSALPFVTGPCPTAASPHAAPTTG